MLCWLLDSYGKGLYFSARKDHLQTELCNGIPSMLTKSCKLQQNQKDKKKLTAGQRRHYKSQLESKVVQWMSRELMLALTDSSVSVSNTTLSKQDSPFSGSIDCH